MRVLASPLDCRCDADARSVPLLEVCIQRLSKSVRRPRLGGRADRRVGACERRWWLSAVDALGWLAAPSDRSFPVAAAADAGQDLEMLSTPCIRVKGRRRSGKDSLLRDDSARVPADGRADLAGGLEGRVTSSAMATPWWGRWPNRLVGYSARPWMTVPTRLVGAVLVASMVADPWPGPFVVACDRREVGPRRPGCRRVGIVLRLLLLPVTTLLRLGRATGFWATACTPLPSSWRSASRRNPSPPHPARP